MTSVSVPTSLIHGIRADGVHWTDCWNFSLAGTRTSVEVIAAIEGTPSLRDAPMDVLRERPTQVPATFLSPFASLVFQGAMLRAGMRLGYGSPPFQTRWFSDKDEQRTLLRSDRELLFEEVRRTASPDKPSRLACIWAAENTTAGRNYVEGLMGRQSFVVEVEVVVMIRVAKCDAHWLDHWQNAGVDAAGGYRSGQPMNEDPLWEYLIEGSIRATDPDDVARIRQWAWNNIPPDIRGGQGPA